MGNGCGSGEAMEVCGSGENENAVVAATVVIPSIYTSEDGDGGGPPSLGSLVEGLRDELRGQKGAYEARIKK